MVQSMLKLVNNAPYVIAYIKGNKEYSKIKGKIEFFPWSLGSIVKLEITGLPSGNKNNFFELLINENDECKECFSIKDLPKIYPSNDYAFMLYYTSKFKPDFLIGKIATIQIVEHLNEDSTNKFYKKIAYGKILKRKWLCI